MPWRVAWAWLLLAIALEVSGTAAMKLSAGLTRPLWSLSIYVLYAASLSAFPLALKGGIEVSTAYAVWSGIGTTLTALIGVVRFGDTMNGTKALALVAIMGGCVLISFSDEAAEASEAEGDNR